MSLATKYRPKEFKEVVSQQAVIRILEKQIEKQEYTNCYLFAGPSGCGKAQPLNSKIFAPDGYKLMGEIKKGDIIFDGDGKETQVLEVFPQGKRDIYKINFDDGSFIEVADNHLNTVYETKIIRKNHKYMESQPVEHILNTLELQEKIKNGSKYYIPAVKTDFKNQNTSIDPYLLGCLLGDGCITKGHLSFTSKDPEIIESLNKILERDYNMRLKHITRNDYAIRSISSFKYHLQYNGNDYYSLLSLQQKLIEEGYPKIDSKTIIKISLNQSKIYNKKYPELSQKIKLISTTDKVTWNTFGLKKQLETLNVATTSYYKHIPTNYLYNTTAVRKALLQGLMDTDGTVGKCVKKNYNSTSCSFCTTSKQLAEDVLFLSRSLGFRAAMCVRANRFYTYKYKGILEKRSVATAYIINIETDDDTQLFTLKRKQKLVKKHQVSPRKKIVNVEFDRQDLCQCIYVESSKHTYLTDNITITHNTTLARCFANKINKGVGEPIEIDGASNNGVDNIRAIIDSAEERSIEGEYKIYIIDECHMITTAGWNAFLKCIEEPPKYTIFMFCTTNPEKIPSTILNRVMRFNLTKINTNLITERLKYICEQEHYTNYDEACDYISKLSNGGMRDAIASLEKAANYNTDLSINNVLSCLGNFSYNAFFDLSNALYDRNEGIVLSTIDQIYNSGSDLKLFVEQYLDFVLDLTKYCIFKKMDSLKIPNSMEEQIKYTTGIENSLKWFNNLTNAILNIKNTIRNDVNNKTTIEAMLLNICRG